MALAAAARANLYRAFSGDVSCYWFRLGVGLRLPSFCSASSNAPSFCLNLLRLRRRYAGGRTLGTAERQAGHRFGMLAGDGRRQA
jgi:hypothetical protein